MIVSMSRISKACVNGYRGSEIPNAQALGLIPEKVYQLYRHPEELAKSASTADGKPVLLKHIAVTADVPNQELWVGTLGACTFEAPYVVTRPLTVITAEAQALIEADEQRELSCGYRYVADMTPGVTPDGEQYDGVMRDIVFNHCALVREGRVGPDVHVADEIPPELHSMKNRKLIARLQKKIPAFANLKTAELMALDEELSGKRVGEVPPKSTISLTKDERDAACDAALDEKRKAHGADAELTEEERKKAIDAAMDKKRRAHDAKRGKDALRGHEPANDAAAADEKEEAEDAAEKESDEEEAAEDEAEEAEDEKEQAADAEKDDEEARDRRRARDERRRARDRRAGARDARDAARDSRRAARDERKAARDAMPDPNDHRRDFRSGDSRRARDAARATDSMTMDQVEKIVDKAVARETAKVREQVTAEQRALAIAVDEVAPLVGRLQMHAFDSAAEVYGFALEKIGAEVEDDFPEAGLRTLVKNELRHRETARKPAGRQQHAYDAARDGYDPDALFQKRPN